MLREASIRGADTASDASIGRLAHYLRVLSELGHNGVATVSSEALADAAGVQPALLRRDLSQFGHYGTRGVGYQVGTLRAELTRIVGAGQERRVVIVGVGRLGRALVDHPGLTQQGFRVVALVDVDPTLVGTRVAGVPVTHERDLVEVVRSSGAELAIIATPGQVAQHVADALRAAGVDAMLNMTPTLVRVPDTAVRSVDIAQELQILSYHHAQRAPWKDPA